MNEQEQIKGITRLLEETHGICGNFGGCTNRKCSQCYAEDLYNAGYRKADEVRKETAEKILDEVKDMFLNTSYNIDWIFNKLEELAKQYGVEVENEQRNFIPRKEY